MLANRRLIVNSALHSLTFLIPTIVLLALTPYFVSQVGEEGYGIWMLSYAILGLAGTLELGMGLASTKYVAEYAVNRDSPGLSTIFTASLFAYLLLGLAAGAALYFLAPYLGEWIKLQPALKPTAIAAVRIISFAVWPSLAIGAFTGIPRGLQRYSVPSLVNILLTAGAPTGALLILLFTPLGLLAIITWIVILHWLLFLLSVGYAWWALKPFQIRLGIWKEPLRKFIGFSAYSAAANIGGKIFQSGDRVFVGFFLGASAVTYYTVSIGLANKPFYLVGYLTQALVPRVSELSKSQGEGEIVSLFRIGTHFIALIALGSGALMFALSSILLNLWMGVDFTAQSLSSFRWMVVIYSLLGITPVGYYIANGYGFPRVAALGALAGGVLMLALMVPLTAIFGLNGAAIANLGYLFSFAPLIAMLRNFRLPVMKTLWHTLYLPVSIFAGAVAGTLLLPDSLPSAALLSAAITLGFGGLFLHRYSSALKTSLHRSGLIPKKGQLP